MNFVNLKNDQIDQEDALKKFRSLLSAERVQFDISDETVDDEFDANAIADLDRKLSKPNKQLTSMAIANIKYLFTKIKLAQITEEQVQNLLNKLPANDHLENHKSTFELLDYLTERPDFAMQIYDAKILDQINFSEFARIPDDAKTHVSSTIESIIAAVPESIDLFYEIFFPYFYNFIIDKNIYKSGGLSTHLSLASWFIPKIDESDKILEIFSKFTLFIEHTDNNVIESSLYGILVVIDKYSWMMEDNKAFSNPNFVKRLVFLGSHKNPQTGPLVFAIFSYILNSNLELKSGFYLPLAALIKSYLQIPNSSMLNESLNLLSLSFADQSFVDTLISNNIDPPPLNDLIETFIQSYPKLKIKEKETAVLVFANFIYFLPFDIVSQYVNNQDFFEELIDALEFDDPKIVQPLINGIYRLYSKNASNIISVDNTKIIMNSLNSLKSSDDEKLASSSTIVYNLCREYKRYIKGRCV